MLAHIVSLTKNVVVAGSHGKTTTTSLVASIFSKAKIDPTIINGGVLNSFNNSAKLGRSNWCILGQTVRWELYKSSTNIFYNNECRQGHMDYYKSVENLKRLFLKFFEKSLRLANLLFA